MQNKDKKRVSADELEIVSIGACAVFPTEKKKAPCVMLAYLYREGARRVVSYLAVPLPKRGELHTRESLLSAIRKAEHVGHVRCVDYRGEEKPIAFCRPRGGRIRDVVPRDYEHNRFPEEFLEIEESSLRLAIEGESSVAFRWGESFSLNIIDASAGNYPADTFEYAAMNAYNACLLGEVFENEFLRLETKKGTRVRPVVRSDGEALSQNDTLWICPELRDNGDLRHYKTEEFFYIGEGEPSRRTYEIIYRNSSYLLKRV